MRRPQGFLAGAVGVSTNQGELPAVQCDTRKLVHQNGVVSTANRSGTMLGLVPLAWRIAMTIPRPEAVHSVPRPAHLVFEEMAQQGEDVRLLMFHQSGFSVLLLLKRRDDPGLAKIMKFNRRSLRPLVVGITLVHGKAPPTTSA